MTFEQLCEAIQKQAADHDGSRLTIRTIKRVIKAQLEVMSRAACEGEEVTLPGYGKFSPVTRKASKVRNPQNGSLLDVPERKAVKFTQSLTLKRAQNN